MEQSLTRGKEGKVILKFAFPLILGNVFQQLYNIADSMIVGRFLGPNALAAVGSSFTFMVFLTSVILGLCMGASILFSQLFGAKKPKEFRSAVAVAFVFIGITTIVLNILALWNIHPILRFMNIPDQIYNETKEYLVVIFYGLFFVFLYNFFSSVLRSVGNSMMPLLFLILSAVINIVLDILFVTKFQMGVVGAAWATIIAQGISGVVSCIYCLVRLPGLKGNWKEISVNKTLVKHIASYSILASLQQSMMNFGILLIQGLINSFGIQVMAAYAAAVKIDSFAYMPLQEYGNAFSTYVAQNTGAGLHKRVRNGMKSSLFVICIFGAIISLIIFLFAPKFLLAFVSVEEIEILRIGTQYLRVISPFYILIGLLFSFYGFYRGIGKPAISIVLTIASLGLRVVLAYTFAPLFGVIGIWCSIPLGWFLADVVASLFLRKYMPPKENLTVE